MTKYFEASSDIYAMMRSMISEIGDFHPLIDIQDEIAIVMKEVHRPKSDPTASVMTAKTSRAPGVMEAIGRADYKYVITLNLVTWSEFTPEQKIAQIDHCLCAMKVKINEKTGDPSYSVRQPDFVGYIGELKRHGVWREAPDGGSYPAPVEEMFGDGGELSAEAGD